jgi:hypothetical protein
LDKSAPDKMLGDAFLCTRINLSTRPAQYFTNSVRTRWGRSPSALRPEQGSESEMWACVRGSRTYDVELDFSDGILSAWCDCPAFTHLQCESPRSPRVKRNLKANRM